LITKEGHGRVYKEKSQSQKSPIRRKGSLGMGKVLNNSLVVINLGIICLLASCSFPDRQNTPLSLNSRYHEQEPSLSGDGRLLAFISNRYGTDQILIFDLKQQKFVNYPGLNPQGAIATNPSMSRTGRYLVYMSSFQGKPEIVLYDKATRRSEILTLGYRNWIRNPKISPNGRYIVFETSRRGQWDVEVIDRGPNIELDIADGTTVSAPKQN
jgi:Tol biopolymer transport system component